MLAIAAELLDRLTETLHVILRGDKPPIVQLPPDYPDDEWRQFVSYFNRFVGEYNTFSDFIYAIARGELNYEPPKGRMRVVQSFKTLQANLRHLTYKTQQIAAGDLEQRVDFMGDFSTAFNEMTRQLKQAFHDLRSEKERSEYLLGNLNASIQYAQRIQSSLLPSPDSLRYCVADHFALWLPRDSVGGDIYCMEPCDGGGVIALIDCTGHGVPGALMTMLASVELRRIVRDEGCTDPAQILRRLSGLIKTTLRQDTSFAESDDGLDAAICAVRPGAKQVLFAGAHLPLYYVHAGDVVEIRGDRSSLGYRRSNQNFKFTTHVIPLTGDMAFYLSTDGLLDQPGGVRAAPFASTRLKEHISRNWTSDFTAQKQALLDEFTRYAGKQVRRDDVTVLGWKVSSSGVV